MTDPVHALAFGPFLAIDRPPDWLDISCAGADLVIHGLPMPKIVQPRAGLSDVPTAVDAVRQAAAAHNLSALLWFVPPELGHLRTALEDTGLVNQASPGFEPVETAMVLDRAPQGPITPGISVAEIASLADARASAEVLEAAFGMPAGQLSSAADITWAQAQDPSYPLRQFVARVDGEVVGTCTAALAAAGVNLFGGAVSASARGRGVYTAMIRTRWQMAVDRGTPVLTVQAGQMSMPVLERVGFRKLGEIRVFHDPSIG